MKLVILERNSAGTDIDLSVFVNLGVFGCYPNRVANNRAVL